MERWISQTISLAIVCVVAYLMVSCNTNTQGDDSSENTTTTANTDTNTDSIEIAEPKFLPDTAFPSVENLKYDITIFDSITSGELSNSDDAYADAPGIFTFRGNPFRNAYFCGHIDSVPTDIDIDWTFVTGFDTVKTSFGQWGGGTGWTGQPLYVEWSDSMMQKFGTESDSLTEHLAAKKS